MNSPLSRIPVHHREFAGCAALLLSVLALVYPSPSRSETFPIQGTISWILSPEPIAAAHAPAEAKLGEFLFVQPLVASAEAVAEPGAIANIPFPFLGSIAKPLDGERLALVTGGTAGPAFCSINFVKNKGQRLCLADTDRSGVLNYQVRAYGTNAGEPFANMVPAIGVSAKIPYQIMRGPLPALMHAGLVVKRAGSGFRLLFAISERGRTRTLEEFELGNPYFARKVKGAHSRFMASQVPIKLGLYGATVEISAIDGNRVRYSVVSTFSPNERVVISRAGSLPVAP
jgi:hypothetical protein